MIVQERIFTIFRTNKEVLHETFNEPVGPHKEELDDLLTLASDIEKIQSNTRMSAMISDLPPVFTNQVHVHD